MIELIQGIFRTEGYHPHGFCYLWQPGLVWLHVVADALIGLAYVAIGASLALFVLRGRGEKLPFSKMFVAFGIFIAACGATHFASIWTLWSPVYWFSGGLKAVTAGASVFTALALPPLIPVALATLATARASERHKQDLELAHQRLQEVDQLKTQFFANVSHELRTPLTLILGPVGQMLRESSFPEADRRRLETVEQSAQILLEQVNDLLDVAKLEAGKMEIRYERTDLAQLTRLSAANFESLAVVKGLKPLRVTVPEELQAEIDPEKIRRVLFNLLANAIRFTPAGGEVACELRVRGDEMEDEAPMAVLEIHDSGPGVPTEQREMIFEPYRQAVGAGPGRPTGTGLGLAIVSEMVNLHGGSVRVEDSPLGGAAFILELPLRAPHGAEVFGGPAVAEIPAEVPSDLLEPERPSSPGAAELDTDPSRPLILVVEDNPEMNAFTTDSLKVAHRVVQAYDGESGVRLAKELRPDLIVSDIMMPVMTGEDLVNAIRADRSLDAVPIILLSARADDEMRLRLLQTGVQDYLTKPYSAEELRARVANWMRVKRVREILRKELDSKAMDLEELAVEISGRKQELEAALEQARLAIGEAEAANRAKSDFLGIMSHELRTPLNAIFGYVDLLESGLGGDLNEKQRQYAARTRRSAEHLLQLVDEILTFARIEAGAERPELQLADVAAIVSDVAALSEPGATLKSLAFDVQLPNEPIVVRTDPARLSRVILNLVSNAVKFTDDGSVTLSLEARGGEAVITVHDTGPGIPAEHREQIFHPFWQADTSMTRKAGGTGLGLSIARELTRLLGGRLELESEEGAGATFRVALPMADPGGADG